MHLVSSLSCEMFSNQHGCLVSSLSWHEEKCLIVFAVSWKWSRIQILSEGFRGRVRNTIEFCSDCGSVSEHFSVLLKQMAPIEKLRIKLRLRSKRPFLFTRAKGSILEEDQWQFSSYKRSVQKGKSMITETSLVQDSNTYLPCNWALH